MLKEKIENIKDLFRNEVNKVKKTMKSEMVADVVYRP